MLVQSLRLSRPVVARSVRQHIIARTLITPTAVRQADAVQTLYLNGLRDYKPRPEKIADAKGIVKEWAAPTPPNLPAEASGAFSSELPAYQQSAVEVDGQETAADGDVAAKEEDWFDADVAFRENDKSHH